MTQFAPGDPVRVRKRYPPGHTRAPYYARGKTGVVERICGTFHNPEQLAYGRPAEKLTLYRVRFPVREFWDEVESPNDTIDIEIYENWLEPA